MGVRALKHIQRTTAVMKIMLNRKLTCLAPTKVRRICKKKTNWDLYVYIINNSNVAPTDQSAVIEPGIHTYTFACQLPSTCPSSFEGFYGYIRYLVKVELVRPWKFNQHFTRGFTVLKVMDLNYHSPLLRVSKLYSKLLVVIWLTHYISPRQRCLANRKRKRSTVVVHVKHSH